jgi:hypothetical protein
MMFDFRHRDFRDGSVLALGPQNCSPSLRPFQNFHPRADGDFMASDCLVEHTTPSCLSCPCGKLHVRKAVLSCSKLAPKIHHAVAGLWESVYLHMVYYLYPLE